MANLGRLRRYKAASSALPEPGSPKLYGRADPRCMSEGFWGTKLHFRSPWTDSTQQIYLGCLWITADETPDAPIQPAVWGNFFPPRAFLAFFREYPADPADLAF